MNWNRSRINRDACDRHDDQENWGVVDQFFNDMAQGDPVFNGDITFGGPAAAPASPAARPGHPNQGHHGQVPQRPGAVAFNGPANLRGAVNLLPGAALNIGPGVPVTYTSPPAMADWLKAQPIGRKIIWEIATDGAIPTGWVAYATDGKYLKINNTTQGGTGGNATHNHGGNTGSASTLITVSDHAHHHHAATGITVSDHPDHHHVVPLTAEAAAGSGTGIFGGNLSPDTSVPNIVLTHTVGGSTDNESATQTHTVVESPHIHAISSANNDPEYFEILLIKKVS